jgi:periplasmic protein TonB
MKKLACVVALFTCVYSCTAQTDSTKKKIYIVSATDTTYMKPEEGASFPDGQNGWRNFLNRNLRYPEVAIQQNIEGTVVLRFVVCTDGTVCDIEAISGPEELRESAVNALKRTPRWVPAMHNGQNVRSFKKQPIVFHLGRRKYPMR